MRFLKLSYWMRRIYKPIGAGGPVSTDWELNGGGGSWELNSGLGTWELNS